MVSVPKHSSTHGVNNLSSVSLTNTQLRVLSYGLNFVPSQPPLNVPKQQQFLQQSLQQFQRHINLHYYFSSFILQQSPTNKNQQKTNNLSSLKLPNLLFNPTSLPSHLSQPLQQHLDSLYASTLHGVVSPSFKYNLSWEEKSALNELYFNKNIIIKEADKNLGPTVLDRSWYHKEAMRQLSDRSVYVPVAQVPFGAIHEELKSTLDNAYHLDRSEKEYLLHPFACVDGNKKPDVPAFYLCPKIHKQPLKGRPIVANHSWCLKNVATYLDRQLQPVVKRLPHLLSNTIPLLNTLSTTKLPSDCLLITADVTSLYTNIPHTDGINAVRDTLNLFGGLPPHQVSLLVDLLALVLDHNYLDFNKQVYHQVSGTAMGSQMAPCYANIFMYCLEESWLHKHQHKILLYRRYLDDIFLVFKGNKTEAQDCLNEFNTLHANIKIAVEISNQSCSFLDLCIFKGASFSDCGLLDTKTFNKTFSRFLYLPFTSFHPLSVKKAFIKGEAIRFLRNSSCVAFFREAIACFQRHLKNRGYPPRFVRKLLSTVSYNMRSSYLLPKNKVVVQDVPVVNLKLPYVYASVLRPSDLVKFCEASLQCKVNVSWVTLPPLGQKLVRSRC